jgi:hypothetical protein
MPAVFRLPSILKPWGATRTKLKPRQHAKAVTPRRPPLLRAMPAPLGPADRGSAGGRGETPGHGFRERVATGRERVKRSGNRPRFKLMGGSNG